MSFLELFSRALDDEGLVLFTDLELVTTDHAGLAPSTGHDGSVRRDTTTGRQNTLRGPHTTDVFGGRVFTDQNDFFSSSRHFFGRGRGEANLSDGRPGATGQTNGHNIVLVEGRFEISGIKVGVQDLSNVIGLYLEQGFVGRAQAFVDQVAGNLQGRFARALTATALQHPQLAVFDGEFDILHILEMIFELVDIFQKLFVGRREGFFHDGNVLGRTNTRDHVFSLGIDQVFTSQFLYSRAWITRKGHTGTRTISEVTKDHGLNVTGSSKQVGDVINLTVLDGTF
mmetsp:Transcript_17991/g.34037  ORF Transcript_17991/g.34037 Transcript_17991/m.34037 type:complete len:284 (-) Transcript_17991:3005-3856(-)